MGPTLNIVINPANFQTGTNGHGSVFGGQFGYNSQVGPSWVVGVEADISATTIKGTQTISNGVLPGWPLGFGQTPNTTAIQTLETRLRDLGSVRAKLGFVPWDSVLIYGTGGLSWAQVDEALTISAANFAFFQPPPLTYSASLARFGWSAGAGADWKIGQNVVLGILYLHYDMGSASTEAVATDAFSHRTATTALPKSRLTADTITGRISWLFK